VRRTNSGCFVPELDTFPAVRPAARPHIFSHAEALDSFNDRLKPASIIGLMATVVLIFGLQAPNILAKPGAIALIAVPLLVQSYGIFAIAYGLAWVMRIRHEIAAPAAMIGTSNFFELAVAVAISLFGLQSGATLATVVGVLIEVRGRAGAEWATTQDRRSGSCVTQEASEAHELVGGQ